MLKDVKYDQIKGLESAEQCMISQNTQLNGGKLNLSEKKDKTKKYLQIDIFISLK